jgi:uncharacterized protein (DUF4213/DUF364 family)
MPFDPIRHFYKKLGCNQNLIREIVMGEKYIGVMLADGRVGVCATVGHEIEKVDQCFTVNLQNPTQRIILNAYYNALLNGDQEYLPGRDIFEEIDFRRYRKVVMVGWFRSLQKKFLKAKIGLDVYDMLEQNPTLMPIGGLQAGIEEADAMIVTATTIANGTLKGITDAARGDCDIFLLGPSAIMHEDMFRYTPIRGLFGSVFTPHDKEVLNIIRAGNGTPEFASRMEKVFMMRPADEVAK